MRRRLYLNMRFLLVTLCLLIPVIFLVLWINARNIESLRKEKLSESQAEVGVAVSQLDTVLELLENSISSLSINNPDYLTVANATVKSTDFWLTNQRIMEELYTLGTVSSFRFCVFAYYPNTDLFINSKVNPDITTMLHNTFNKKSSVSLKNRWNTVWCNNKAYIIRVISYENYYIGTWIDYSSFEAKLGLSSTDESKYYFTDIDGKILNTAGNDYDNTVNSIQYYEEDKNHWYIVDTPSSEADFKLVKVINSHQLYKELPRVTYNFFLISGVLLMLLVVFNLCIYRWIIVPMNQIKKGMSVIEAGDMTYRLSGMAKESVEFNSLIEQFNSMMSQLEHLKIEVYEGKLDRQETKLQYLSQQIQPHFILNALNTLYNERDQKTTKDMILLLSKYFRHVVNVNSKYVRLGQELEHINNYLKLQKMRYPNAFEYVVQCDNALEIIPVPPFIIESFVENAFKYGLIPGEEGLLRIDVASLEAFKVSIRISDTGWGFSEDILDSIQEFIEKGIVTEDLGIGIHNSIDRLRLIYNDDVIIRFYNQQPHGAVVELKITLQREDNNGNQSANCR